MSTLAQLPRLDVDSSSFTIAFNDFCQRHDIISFSCQIRFYTPNRLSLSAVFWGLNTPTSIVYIHTFLNNISVNKNTSTLRKRTKVRYLDCDIKMYHYFDKWFGADM